MTASIQPAASPRTWRLQADAPLLLFSDDQPVVLGLPDADARATEARAVDTLTGRVEAVARVAGGSVHLGVLPRGHYRVEVSGAAPGSAFPVDHLAVVPARAGAAPSEYVALDVAATYHADPARIEEMARAIAMVGVGWVRERLRWNLVEDRRGEIDAVHETAVAATMARHGLRVLQCVHNSPPWAAPAGGILPDDVRATHGSLRALAELHRGAVAGWEFWNESDWLFTTPDEPADHFTALLKAAALGVREADASAAVVNGGFALDPNEYTALCLDNDMLAWVDAVAHHTYPHHAENRPLSAYAATTARYLAHLDEHGAAQAPRWITEAGTPIVPEEGRELSERQQWQQARYMATSLASARALGVERFFWFLATPFMEWGGMFGMTSHRYTPYATWPCLAALVEALGDGVPAGALRDRPAGVSAPAFHRGDGRTVLALWSDDPAPVELPLGPAADGVEVRDIAGRRLALDSEGGVLRLVAGPEILYVSLPRRTAEALLAGAPPSHGAGAGLPVRESSRVVPRLRASVEAARDSSVMGYRAGGSGGEAFALELSSFAAEDVAGTLRVEAAPPGWTVEPASTHVVVPAQQTLSVPVAIQPPPGADPAEVHRVRIVADLDDGRAVVAARVHAGGEVPLLLPVAAAADASAWRVPGDGDGGVRIEQDGDAVRFTYHFGEGGGAAYPELAVAPDPRWREGRGLAFTMASPAACHATWVQAWLVLDDGREYVVRPGFGVHPGARQVRVPFADFSFWIMGPGDSARDIDPGRVRAVRIGLRTFGTATPPLGVSGLGIY